MGNKKKKPKAKANGDNAPLEDTKQTIDGEEPDSLVDDQPQSPPTSAKITEEPVLPLTSDAPAAPVNGVHKTTHETKDEDAGDEQSELKTAQTGTEERLAAAARERDELREEVTQLRKSLEDIQRRHEEDIARHKEQQTELDAQYAKANEDKLNAELNLNDGLRSQVSELQKTLEQTQHRHEEEVSRLAQQRAEHDAKNAASQETEAANSEVAKERDDLKERLAEARESLGSAKKEHEEALAKVNAELEETQSGKEQAESQYKTLLGKVNTIRTQLGERLKADAADLAQARTQIEELEEQIRTTQESNESLRSQLGDLSRERDERAKEVADLRNRANMTQQNWVSERDDLIRREALAREEFETAKQAMQDWEVLAMEERSIREGLADRVSELEEQIASQQQAYERAAAERDDQSSTVDGLQRALHDIQEARKQELRETVEGYQSQLEDLRKQLSAAEETSQSAQKELDSLKQDLDKVLPFEKEVKEKNLLIGKLRHEAVILNDHLTKALKYIKRSKPDDTVDKQLVTNTLLQFLALDRTDPKKFQVLQIIAATLGWTEEQQEAAGLSRPGASHQTMNPNQSLRLPLSPFVRRVSSSASFHQPLFSASSTSLSSMTETGGMTSPSGKESLSELWSGFLEREAQEGLGSRNFSVSSGAGAPPAGMRSGPSSPTVSRSVSRYALPKMEEDEKS